MTDNQTSPSEDGFEPGGFRNMGVVIRAATMDQDRIDEISSIFGGPDVRGNVAKFCEKTGYSYYRSVRELFGAGEIGIADPRYLAGCEAGMTTHLRKTGKELVTTSELSEDLKGFASEVKDVNPVFAARLKAIASFDRVSFYSAAERIEDIAMSENFPEGLQQSVLVSAARCVSSGHAEASRAKTSVKSSSQDER